MTPGTHRLPTHLFTAIALGGGDVPAIRSLAGAQHSKNRLLIRLMVDLAERSGHPGAASARTSYQVLAELERAAPAVVADLLRYPVVGAWVTHTVAQLSGPEPGDRASPGQLALVAAAAAVRAGVSIRIDTGDAIPPTQLRLPSLGTARLPAGRGSTDLAIDVQHGTTTLSRSGHRVLIPADPHRDTPGWTGLPQIAAGTRLPLMVTIDTPAWRSQPGAGQPHRLVTDPHRVDLGHWRRQVAAGWDLLTRHHEPIAREVSHAVTVLTPLETPEVGTVSATFRHAFGAVAMCQPSEAQAVALTFAHEIQHAKLAALMDLFPLIEPGRHELFYAPWRDDPRPLEGLLHGVYAHLGVAAFWRVQRHVEVGRDDALAAHTAFARWRTAALEGAQLLTRTGRLTPIGLRFVAHMLTVLDRWEREPVPAEARRRAKLLATDHQARHRARSLAHPR